jgi:hypothetical protein
MKTDTPTKKKALRTGLTEMRREKHNYDGYLVRRSRFNYSFHRYVGAGVGLYKGVDKSPASTAARFKDTLVRASLALDSLDRTILDPNAWRTSLGKKQLTKKAALALIQLGFKIKSPA